jgi:hypothetical protein
VLIFALIILVFTIYQADVVPAQNKEVEFEHSQVVESDMSQLNDAIQEASTSGLPQSASVATGLQYPSRALAINPGNPSGTLRTSSSQQVELSGLSGSSGYWSTNPSFDTRLVSYQSNYNQMQQEAEYTIENGLLVNDYSPDSPSDNFILGSDGTMISENGNQINLLLVDGDYQKSSITSSVTATPVSTSTEYHQLDSSSGGTIKVPTSLPEEIWQNEIVDGAAGIQSVSVSGGVATLNLKDQVYDLRLTKVTLGTSSEPDATYLKSEDPSDPSETIDATVGESETFTVSVRDRFGNAYTSDDVTVTATLPDGTTSEVELDEGGRAEFTYEPTDEDVDNSPVEIELSTNGGGEDYETVTYELDVGDNSDENDGDSGVLGSGDITNGYGLEPSIVTIDSAEYEAGGNSKVTFEFHNRGGNDAPAMKAVKVQLNGALGGPSDSPTSGEFNGEPINFNGEVVNLKPDGGTPDNTFTLAPGEERSIVLDNLDENINDGGLLLVTVEYEYEYTEDGETKTGTDTATYAVAVSQSTGASPELPAPFERVLLEPGPQPE